MPRSPDVYDAAHYFPNTVNELLLLTLFTLLILTEDLCAYIPDILGRTVDTTFFSPFVHLQCGLEVVRWFHQS